MPYSKLYKRTEAIAEIQREQGQRKNDYPCLIETGKLDKTKANHQFLRLDCIRMVLEGMTNDQFRHFYAQGKAKMEAPPAQRELVFEPPEEE